MALDKKAEEELDRFVEHLDDSPPPCINDLADIYRGISKNS